MSGRLESVRAALSRRCRDLTVTVAGDVAPPTELPHERTLTREKTSPSIHCHADAERPLRGRRRLLPCGSTG
jgi:hypothetical protein